MDVETAINSDTKADLQTQDQVFFPNPTPEDIRKLISNVMATELPDELAAFAARAGQTPWDRGIFIWKWVYFLLRVRSPGSTLSSVPEGSRADVALAKSCMAMAVVLIDDIADNVRDPALLDVLVQIPLGPVTVPEKFNPTQQQITELVSDLFATVYSLLEKSPCWKNIEKVWYFDLGQVLTSFQYSELMGDVPQIINHTENKAYSCHNMTFFLCADIDLALSPDSEWLEDLGHIRELIWHCQNMGRIGNWVTTWERELNEKDLSSGVVTYSVSERIISLQQFLSDISNDKRSVKQNIVKHNIEEKLSEHWEQHCKKAIETSTLIKHIDGKEYVDGMINLAYYQLAGRGLK